RASGEYLHSIAYVKQDWAMGIDEKGRPMRAPGKLPTPEGNKVYPQVTGGTNWNSPSFSPETGLMYVAVREGASVYSTGEAEYRPGTRFQGSFFDNKATEPDWWGAVRALDVLTGEKRWEHKLLLAPMAGVMATAGGLVFTGTEDGYFMALDARTGKDLWHMNLGGRVIAGPMSYSSRGRQHVAIAAGGALFALALP
ncbi:MAG: PQQ-binding-like beta-propeller repeat protein, partial [Acidobacteria bacterium]|nr:PQQ-binding-like beta-propeller repeat protein [Acidobacteriota bacterium]